MQVQIMIANLPQLGSELGLEIQNDRLVLGQFRQVRKLFGIVFRIEKLDARGRILFVLDEAHLSSRSRKPFRMGATLKAALRTV